MHEFFLILVLGILGFIGILTLWRLEAMREAIERLRAEVALANTTSASVIALIHGAVLAMRENAGDEEAILELADSLHESTNSLVNAVAENTPMAGQPGTTTGAVNQFGTTDVVGTTGTGQAPRPDLGDGTGEHVADLSSGGDGSSGTAAANDTPGSSAAHAQSSDALMGVVGSGSGQEAGAGDGGSDVGAELVSRGEAVPGVEREFEPGSGDSRPLPAADEDGGAGGAALETRTLADGETLEEGPQPAGLASERIDGPTTEGAFDPATAGGSSDAAAAAAGQSDAAAGADDGAGPAVDSEADLHSE